MLVDPLASFELARVDSRSDDRGNPPAAFDELRLERVRLIGSGEKNPIFPLADKLWNGLKGGDDQPQGRL